MSKIAPGRVRGGRRAFFFVFINFDIQNELKKGEMHKTFFVLYVVFYQSVYEQPPLNSSWFQRYGCSKRRPPGGHRAGSFEN
jgi:hypothetical protein